ncbi:folylpolyglutamate synthase/dihydrofolate synthase family protein [Arenibacter sp. F20364]|uniref:bifunctional folylpolyglutamate synthase/dihydrofolate synthase n=1 Tax=Arenibacter sp. F20364 TaxID=2926415 RepID=UPI001FF13212|nr:folylpolyglutamate synthase/dihydrofolate synthase family protein [Arenibacter sp. F20364]MCK0191770.1 bifunctional folylpolyglutamate synthase/dihydrofolate synthase [Arenibacter sp. F20364]
MTYQETLEWMFGQLPMYQQKGISAFKGKLDNILALSAYLGHPERKFKSIHVAGTNGKGSCSHMLASILQEAGYKVGLYTSPHLKDFRERIRINGIPVSKKFVVDFIKKNKLFFEAHDLSFFEMTVGMAFQYFEKEKIDIAIVEVGLGGRLDSTNIIIPEVSLITNIGYDHVEMLGDTIAKIAFEKAGIIKPGIPVVISELQEETATVFNNMAKERNSKIVFAGEIIPGNYKTSLLGSYQAKNVKGVVATIKELKGFDIREEHIVDGLLNVSANTGLLGRWQYIGENPTVVCDTAHNTEGLSIVLDQIEQQKYTDLHLVIGFVKDKNLEQILPLFPKNAHYYFCRPNIQRGLDELVLKTRALEFGLKGDTYSSVNEAVNAALGVADTTDFVFVGGSTFVVAEIV